MFKISIPKPCFEGWENMIPNEIGRHCNACAKTVVDFSVMSDEAVQQYFIDHFEQKICGRFKNAQLQRIVITLPQNIFRIPLPFWKKFLVAFLICFGGSFLAIDTTIAGNSFYQGDTVYQQTKTPQAVIKKSDTSKKRKHKKKDYTYILDISTTGAVSIVYPISVLEDRTLSGFCVIKKEPDTNFPFENFPSYPGIPENPKADTGTTVKSDVGNFPEKKKSKPNIPDPETAFILPTALAFKKPFSKKKKV